MVQHFPLLVPGSTGKGPRIEVRAPFDGAAIATVEAATREVVDRAFATAYALYRDRDVWLPAARRIEILNRAADIMVQRRDELAREAAREGGKPLVDSVVEVNRAIDGMHVCVEYLRTQGGHDIPMNLNAASANRLAVTRHEPIGVVLAFSAFNHPLNLIVHQVGPAIAVGCPAIVKPAQATPLSCFRFVEILREAGLPAEWCQALITADRDLTTSMVGDPRLGFFTFIGSGSVGWMLRARLAAGARCSLEHGGVAPVIVAADADLDNALPLLVKGGFYHAGQVCVSVQRVFAARSIAANLAQRMAELAERLRVGDPTLPDTEVGPLIRRGEVERVDQWVQEAVRGGAKLLCGGKAISASCYAPTVLFDPPADSRVMNDEVFGPVVCVAPFDSIDEAVARANTLLCPFQAAVFTRDIDTAMGVSRRIDAATVMVNDHTAFRVDWMPFAGLKHAGLGVGGIPYTMREMQIEKQIIIRSKEL